jgi:hypothetical protein
MAKAHKITGPWTYHTTEITIDYGDGSHDVTPDIFKAWEAAHGKGASATDTSGDTDTLQG